MSIDFMYINLLKRWKLYASIILFSVVILAVAFAIFNDDLGSKKNISGYTFLESSKMQLKINSAIINAINNRTVELNIESSVVLESFQIVLIDNKGTLYHYQIQDHLTADKAKEYLIFSEELELDNFSNIIFLYMIHEKTNSDKIQPIFRIPSGKIIKYD